MKIVTSLILMDCANPDRILLGEKKDSGELTTPGGKLEEGETIRQCAIRELKEETGLSSKNMTYLGYAEILSRQLCMHYFFVEAWTGVLKNREPHKVCSWDFIRLDTASGLTDGCKAFRIKFWNRLQNILPYFRLVELEINK